MQRKMAFMTLFGTNPNAKFKYDRYFQIMPNGPDPAVGLTKGFFEVAMTMDPKPSTVALVGADAEYPHAALEGARTNVKAAGLKVVYDKTYPTTTTDFTPIVRAVQATNPDLVFVASYPPDSAGIVRAANEVALKTRQFGGAMIGVQYANIKTQLGPLLNGVVAWEVYAPEPTIKFPGVEQFLARYQPLAVAQQLDPLGFFLPPYAYAMMQIVGEAVQRVGKIDQEKIAEDIHSHEFTTVVGNVRFAKNGEWAEGRPLFALGLVLYGLYHASFERRGREPLRGLAFFFGILFVTEVALILAFGVDYRSVTARYIDTTLRFGPVDLPLRLFVPFAVSVAMTLSLQVFLSRTFFGRAVLAVGQDQLALQLMGVDPVRIKQIAFGLSIATAGVAGALLVVIQPVQPSLGREYIGLVFAIPVLGGMGSIAGTLVGAAILGLATSFTATFFGPSWSPAVSFGLLLFALAFRPAGLFGR